MSKYKKYNLILVLYYILILWINTSQYYYGLEYVYGINNIGIYSYKLLSILIVPAMLIVIPLKVNYSYQYIYSYKSKTDYLNKYLLLKLIKVNLFSALIYGCVAIIIFLLRIDVTIVGLIALIYATLLNSIQLCLYLTLISIIFSVLYIKNKQYSLLITVIICITMYAVYFKIGKNIIFYPTNLITSQSDILNTGLVFSLFKFTSEILYLIFWLVIVNKIARVCVARGDIL